MAAPDEGQVARAPDDPAAAPDGVVAGTMTGRRDPVEMMMTGRVVGDRVVTMTGRRGPVGTMTIGRVVGDRVGTMTGRRDPVEMMTGRAGSMIVTGRRGPVEMMMTGRVVGDRAGTMTGRAGSMIVTGRRVRAGMMTTGRVDGDRAETMTGRRGPVGTMTTDPSGRSASRGPRRSVVRRKSVVARVDGARTLSRRDPLNGRSSCG